MRRILPLFLLFTLSLLSLSVPAPAAAQGGDEGWMLSQLNALRAQNGLGPLTWNGQLAAAAAAHSQYLATSSYVGPHIEANGSSPQSRAAGQGYGGRVGENVVGGSTATAQWSWNWWLNSAVHLNNMLGPWNEVGIAMAEGSYGRWYVMDFGDSGGGGAPPPAQAPVNTNNGGQTNTNGEAGAIAGPPRPTKPPPPTATPTITLTPSLTFTPRASFTPLPTGTSQPATETPIVMDLTVPDASPTPPPTATVEAATIEPTAQAIAILPTQDSSAPPPAPKLADAAAPASSSPARTVIPIVIGLQLVVVGLLAVRSVLRRAKR